MKSWEKSLNEMGFNHPPLHQFIHSLVSNELKEIIGEDGDIESLPEDLQGIVLELNAERQEQRTKAKKRGWDID